MINIYRILKRIVNVPIVYVTHVIVKLFKYKLENIIDLNKQYFQKKYIPQPIYVKNLF